VVTADGALVGPVPPQVFTFPAAGTVLDVPVTEGQAVKQDQVLAQMDPLPLSRALAEARAALATAREQLDKLQQGPDAAAMQTAQSEVQTAAAAVKRLEDGTDLRLAELDVERAKNSLWGAQAQRDSTCGASDKGFATQASCDQAQANAQAGEDAVRIAQENLAAKQASSAQDLAAARARLSAAQSRLTDARKGASASEIEAAKARVEQAQGGVLQAESDLARAVLKAPFAATVDRVHVAEGVEVGPGTPIITLVKTDPLRFATTNLSERDVGLVLEGAAASITLTAFPDTPLDGSVQRISPQAAESASGATVFTVFIELADTDGMALRPGMTGRVEIEVPEG
jgi:multidrug resistance efflux pump